MMRSQILAVYFLVPAVYPTKGSLIQPGAFSVHLTQLVRDTRPAHFQLSVVIELSAQARLGIEGAAPATLARIPERLVEGTHTAIQAIAESERILRPAGLIARRPSPQRVRGPAEPGQRVAS